MPTTLRDFVRNKSDLLKLAIENPDLTKKTLACINGMLVWCKRRHMSIKHLSINGPHAAGEGYHLMFKLGRKS